MNPAGDGIGHHAANRRARPPDVPTRTRRPVHGAPCPTAEVPLPVPGAPGPRGTKSDAAKPAPIHHLTTRPNDNASPSTHAGGSLDEGKTVGDGCIRCPLHGSVFWLSDGEVVRLTGDHRRAELERQGGKRRVLVRSATQWS
ncbi:Rieske 2Fe-2S domain-containing protein [Streptomyces sp. NPDC051956]|uniref:Rieske 2Fe-2S domain-containing protein n=1 Tax=Streptomyces sp. NPDC051956 TaxID=3365677 RepID=UPI0037D48F3B